MAAGWVAVSCPKKNYQNQVVLRFRRDVDLQRHLALHQIAHDGVGDLTAWRNGLHQIAGKTT